MSDLTLTINVPASAVADALWNNYDSDLQKYDFMASLFSQLPLGAQLLFGEYVMEELGWEKVED